MTGKKYAAALAVVAATYAVAGHYGLALAFVHRSATAVWPPTGIALAACLLVGYRIWPAIFTAAFFVNLATGVGIVVSTGIAIGNTLEGLIGAYLSNRFAHGRMAFDRPQDVFKFALIAGVLSTLVSATIGVTTVVTGGQAAWAEYPSIWLTWWLGDTVGAFLVAPCVILWSQQWRMDWHRQQALEILLLTISLLFIGGVVFQGWLNLAFRNYPLEFLCIPILIWAAFRFGPREASTASLLLSGIAVWGTLRGLGPFARESPNVSLLLLQSYLGVVTIMVIAVAAVVRERRAAEEQLRRQQKVESIGAMAAGVAHDFNNALTVIEGYAHLLRTEVSSDDLRLTGVIEEILRAADNASTLSSQLLVFSRSGGRKQVIADVNHVVASTEKMLRRIIGEHIELRTEIRATSATIKVEQGQLEQVLMNLSLNARDAMPKGGVLSIKTDNVERGGTRYVRLSVVDTGVGIDADTQSRIFDPFFTTKGANRGTGLGLSTVRQIVKEAGGEVMVRSEPGQGATFYVCFPTYEVVTDVKEQIKPIEIIPSPAGETIVLVEDEWTVRQVTQSILELAGYRVLVADNVHAAFRTFEQHRGSIALLLTDVLMPIMNGPELARQLQESNPDLKVLYMSGYARDVLTHRTGFSASAPLLTKPYSPYTLSRAVCDVLDSEGRVKIARGSN